MAIPLLIPIVVGVAGLSSIGIVWGSHQIGENLVRLGIIGAIGFVLWKQLE